MLPGLFSKHAIRRYLQLSCCLVWFISWGGSAESLTSLRQLLQSNQTTQAWQLARQLQPAHEGDANFDYLYGLAARAAGELDLAVFALERAAFAAPQAADIQLALAVSYLELGNLQAASQTLATLSAWPLPAELADLVRRYQQQIAALPDPSSGYWQNFLQLGIGSDSNPNNGVADDMLQIPGLGDVRLFSQSVAQRSSFADLQAQLSFIKPLDQQTAVYLSAALLETQHQQHAVWSRRYADLSAGYQTRWRDYRLAASLYYRPLQLDNEQYLALTGGRASLSYPIKPDIELGVSFELAAQDYAELASLDKTIWLLDSFGQWQSGQSLHKVFIRYGREQSESGSGQFHDRDIRGFGYQLRQPLAQDWQAEWSLEAMRAPFAANHPLYNLPRQDRYWRSELLLNYQFRPDWQFGAALSWFHNNSNINLYQYRRQRLWTGVRYVF